MLMMAAGVGMFIFIRSAGLTLPGVPVSDAGTAVSSASAGKSALHVLPHVLLTLAAVICLGQLIGKLFKYLGQPPVIGAYNLFPLVGIATEWAMMKELLDTGNFEGARLPKAARGIQNVHWSEGWIPIADNGGGDYFCLDLAPAKGGVVGQVILFGHEGTDQRRVARSFGEWMSKLAGRFQAGKIAFDEDEGLVEE